uniref:KASH domain-containing protein n=1 Tax=Paramormyrops kingsleyae TaxID=1676925 RepID=A0A3B3SXM0_9TELE
MVLDFGRDEMAGHLDEDEDLPECDCDITRVRKLRETLVAMQQLDKNMSSLKSWLAHMETQLARPIIYDTCDAQEIEKKLGQQQELQRDIEKHSTGVASVLNLCEVLLHDSDAYSTEADCESIQQATRSLDRRWRSICAMSMERRLKIEETGRLWQKFLDDFLRFESWLSESERTAALPNSSGVLYTVAKEELKKFEAFQRQVQESLTQLELINKQYRRLARENRTDSSSRLRQMVHDGNQRWDNLQKRAASILRRLKHFISQREEFEAARDSILVWLTEMDLQLTNIEHFSECDVQAKIRQLKAFQQEISLNTSKMEHVFHQGEVLIEKSEPLDATVIEEELEELQRYYQEVFGRVERYYKRLTRLPFTDDEHTGSDHELDLDDVTLRWNDNFRKSPLATSGCSPTVVMASHAEPSGRDTPASVDSIPLEWDHDYDLETEREGGSQDRDLEFLHGAAAISDVVIPESPEAYVKLTERTLMSSTGDPDALGTRGQYHLQEADEILRSRTPTSPDLSGSYTGYMRLMGECRSNIDAMKRMGGELSDGQDELLGLVNLNTTESQMPGVIERWELAQAQAQAQSPEQNLQRWQQLHADLDSMLSWLHQAEEELLQLRRLDRSLDIHDIELRIRKLKGLQKAVDSRKPILLSINLSATELFKSEPSDSQEVGEAQLRLTEMNGLWERLGTSLEDWRQSLQDALMHCHDFHEMSHGLLLWLENIDRRRSEVTPIDASLDRVTLLEHHGVLRQIQTELLDSQQKVTLLEDMSVQLLVHTQGGDCLEAGEKVHVISNRLKLLLKEVTKDLQELEELLRRGGLSSWSSVDERDTSGSGAAQPGRSSPTQGLSPRGKCRVLQLGPPVSRPYRRSSQDSGSGSSRCEARAVPFLLRVLRAALPLQLLLLLLLALACLVPATQEDYSCALSNNFARSFHPMLRYTNGPPPI